MGCKFILEIIKPTVKLQKLSETWASCTKISSYIELKWIQLLKLAEKVDLKKASHGKQLLVHNIL